MSVETRETNKHAVEQSNEAIASGAVDALDEYVDDDVVLTFSGEPDATGIDAYKEFARSMHDAFPDMDIEVLEMVAEGDTVVQHLVARGTHEGEFEGVDPTGNRVEIHGLNLMRFDDGKIVEDLTSSPR